MLLEKEGSPEGLTLLLSSRRFGILPCIRVDLVETELLGNHYRS